MRKRAAFPRLEARREAVGARGEDRDQIARLGMGKHDFVPEHVVGRGEAAGDGHLLVARRVEAVGDRDREIAVAALEQAAGGECGGGGAGGGGGGGEEGGPRRGGWGGGSPRIFGWGK